MIPPPPLFFFQGIPLPILEIPLILSYPGHEQSCRITSHEMHRPHRVLSQDCFIFSLELHDVHDPKDRSVQSCFSVYWSPLPPFKPFSSVKSLIFRVFFFLFGRVSVVVSAVVKQPVTYPSSRSGKKGPMWSCSNVNVWSFIWRSDVIPMMEELRLWTAGLLRRRWVSWIGLLSRLSRRFNHYAGLGLCDHLHSQNICPQLLNRRGVELDCQVRLAFFVECCWFLRFKT